MEDQLDAQNQMRLATQIVFQRAILKETFSLLSNKSDILFQLLSNVLLYLINEMLIGR